MATPYRFRILTPLGSRYDGQVTSIVVPAANGQLGVLGGHAPMVCATISGPLELTEEAGGLLKFTVEPGVLEVKEAEVVLLADQADKVE